MHDSEGTTSRNSFPRCKAKLKQYFLHAVQEKSANIMYMIKDLSYSKNIIKQIPNIINDR